jgi:hypothetical protein
MAHPQVRPPTQYVKRIYRKLDVDSRVTLTRALLRPPASAARPS